MCNPVVGSIEFFVIASWPGSNTINGADSAFGVVGADGDLDGLGVGLAVSWVGKVGTNGVDSADGVTAGDVLAGGGAA
jgi:hypothetical protein